MSNQITTSMVKQFSDNLGLVAQQQGSRLRNAVQLEAGKVGEEYFMDKIGKTNAQKVTSRHADSPLIETPHERRRVTPTDYDWGDMVDSFDMLRVIIADPASAYVTTGGMALGRAIDEEILTAVYGTAYLGKDGSTSAEWDTTDSNVGSDVSVVAVNSTKHTGANAADTGLSVAKLIEARGMLMKNEVLNYNEGGISDVYCVCTHRQIENLEIFHQASNFGYWLSVVNNIDSLIPNYYVHENGSPGLSQSTFVNNYYIRQVDSCGYESNSSIIHSSILTEGISENYQDIEISWSRYRGWDYRVENQLIVADTVNVIYEIYRSENNLDFDRIITIVDTLPFIDGGFTYVDKDLCNLNYTYYVIAKHPDIDEFMSRSNKVSLEPMFVDFTKPLSLSYTTVNKYTTLLVNGEEVQNYTVTEWEEWDQSDINYYKVDRYDNYYGWQEEVGYTVPDSIFIDYEVDVNNDEYLYRVSYHDDCGNSSPESNFGSNILLQGTQYESHYDLNWNAYQQWESGVKNYIIEYYKHQDEKWVKLETLSGTTLDYTDSDIAKEDLNEYNLAHSIDTSYCYRVKAISYSDIVSKSNEYCFIAEPTNYFPNAFSPNNDGINDYFEYNFGSNQTSSFVKSIVLQIFNKWGNLVFETTDLDFKWDGTIQNNGVICPQGTYVVKYEITGFDGSVISENGLIYLLR